MQKICYTCKASLPIASFSIDKQKKDSRDSYCSSCRSRHRYNSRLRNKGLQPKKRGGFSVLSKYPRFYGVWANMKERCDNDKYASYPNYGGRGISYDPRWVSVDNFFADMFFTYKSGLTLDRVNNDGNYDKDNCRWATNLQQQNNRRDNHYITYGGMTKTIAEWARELGLKHNTLWHRIVVYKWSLQDCMSSRVYVKGER